MDSEIANYSIRANRVAVVSDGSAIPGHGNIGGSSALPFIEDKAVLLRELGGLDAFSLCVDTQDTGEIVDTVRHIAPSFGGIDLEGVAAPRCFEIEKRLREALDIPIFQGGRDGTAVAVGAAVINSFRLLQKPLSDLRAVVCGAGALGGAVVKTLSSLGVRDIVVCDSKGIVGASRFAEFEEDKLELLELTNRDGLSGGLAEAARGRNLFIGVSKPHVLTAEIAGTMAKNAVIFALARPEPEILPEPAKAAGAHIIFTGLPDFPNYIDSALAFPGLFRGALDAKAIGDPDEMKLAATYALAEFLSEQDLSENHILPPVSSEGLCEAISAAVATVGRA